MSSYFVYCENETEKLERINKALEARLAAQSEIIKVAKERLRSIRSNSDCRNESEAEQCAHVAEEALAKIAELEKEVEG